MGSQRSGVLLLISCVAAGHALKIRGEVEAESSLMHTLRETYLDTVKRGLMGMLNHHADLRTYHDETWNTRNQCNILFFSPQKTAGIQQGDPVDMCIIKWDAFERLTQVQKLFESARADGVPGDLVECGVWRGGISIFNRALIKAYGDEGKRTAWAFDSFGGMPSAQSIKEHSIENIRKESGLKQGDAQEWTEKDANQWGGTVTETMGANGEVVNNLLTVQEEDVRNNFARFGLLDDHVKFVKGYFNETLPPAKGKIGDIAILRVDGDLYWSTWDILENLYPKVAKGGYVIADDYDLPASRMAIEDYQKKYNLKFDIKTARFDGRPITREAQMKGMQPFGYWRKE